jgi:hypothetical protein
MGVSSLSFTIPPPSRFIILSPHHSHERIRSRSISRYMCEIKSRFQRIRISAVGDEFLEQKSASMSCSKWICDAKKLTNQWVTCWKYGYRLKNGSVEITQGVRAIDGRPFIRLTRNLYSNGDRRERTPRHLRFRADGKSWVVGIKNLADVVKEVDLRG